ncbi:EAL domain-containing protein [Roseibium porphyridii]|uniref:EAL domain-containing protein n=1 Tax=Roseibium porphyridii TaxID=2866279 RepID=A0ABY8FCR7_9HYPH|nr:MULTISPECIES: EAL domain-containing protein [Stappiaceae]QFT31386.1 Putative cyclic di-GMP phosphodiesterase YliE [Labrenzia sp. THAF82]WFE91982.1 EAL domain-containing protein [Roseibium sp. KMA01]
MSANRHSVQQADLESTDVLFRTRDEMLSVLDFALQPIADIGTGVVYGYEAQVRNAEFGHAPSPGDLIRQAHALGFLAQLETELFRKALLRFQDLRIAQGTKLYFKLDGRNLGEEGDPRLGLGEIVSELGLSTNQICLEFSERHQEAFTDLAHHALNDLRQLGFLITLDDFGRGSSELRLLHDMSPDYVKIDRFFLNDIDSDARRKLFVTTVANLAHVLGSRVIAEGVETEQEFKACREAGCDLIQGQFVAKPFQKAAHAKLFYEHVRAPGIGRKRREEQDRIRNELLNLPTIQFNASMNELLDMVVHNQDSSVIPVLDANNEPRGLIHERDLKAYLYSGGPDDDDAKAALDFPLRSFVRACPIADIDSNADMLLVTFASSINSDGIIITENFRYCGFLSATSLLKIIHAKRLQEAQDQNPLTRLPGNGAITKFISDCARKSTHDRHLCYMDFDNFKPFNDTYGYRQGDRAIILFGELVQRHVSGTDTFHGHLGGDDFFAGFMNADQTDVAARMLALKRAFQVDVESFYDAEHRAQGFMVAQDRFGTTRQFPLLQCSISILTLPKGLRIPPNKLNTEIIALKRAAKRSDDGLAVKFLAA